MDKMQKKILSDRQKRLVRELAVLKRNCSMPNWDGYHADPMSEESYRRASAFVKQFPDLMTLPLSAVDPSGLVYLQWGDVHNSFLTLKFSDDIPQTVFCMYRLDDHIGGKRVNNDAKVLNDLILKYV